MHGVDVGQTGSDTDNSITKLFSGSRRQAIGSDNKQQLAPSINTRSTLRSLSSPTYIYQEVPQSRKGLTFPEYIVITNGSLNNPEALVLTSRQKRETDPGSPRYSISTRSYLLDRPS
jgi:hypothetical protein